MTAKPEAATPLLPPAGTPPTIHGAGIRDVADFVKQHLDVLPVAVPHPEVEGQTVPVVAVPEGRELKSLKPFLDEFRTKPERRSGTAELLDLASLIAHINRFKDTDSAVFAINNMQAPSITAVLDYHKDGAASDPRFGKHRSHYKFPLSKQWKAWLELNGKTMDQGDFAAFLEDRIVDVVAPPDFVHSEFDRNEADKKLADLLSLTEGLLAGPTKLMELSRGLQINIESKVKNAQTLSTGEISLVYEEQHTDGKGTPIKVPNWFLIGIPVFENDAAYRIPVRLRYRSINGVIKWAYQVHRPDLVFDDAFNGACKKVQAETALPLMLGTPE